MGCGWPGQGKVQLDRIKGVVFDLDGTLYSLWGKKMRLSFALWKNIGLLRRVSAARNRLRGVEFSSGETLRRAFCQEISRLSGADTDDVSHWIETQFYPAFIHLLGTKAHVRPGLIPLLERLASRRVFTAVVSDYGRVSERLRALRIDPQLFDEIHSSEDFGALKPSPAPLVALAQKWGVEPGRIVVVGDREDLDAECAKAAEMQYLGVAERALGKRLPDGYLEWQSAVERLDKWSEAEDNAGTSDNLKTGADSASELNRNHGKRSKQVESINGSL